MITFWCEQAWLDDHAADGVRVSTERGMITAVEAGVPEQAADVTLPGLVLPGFANAHSHAFHRALRGRTEAIRGGSFWTWREQMYRCAARLDPDSYYELAKACYAEMVLAGICLVAEFHYLHHQPGGRPYGDPNAMGEALRAAAADAGIRLTLLDTCYLSGGLVSGGRLELNEVQRRFSDGDVDAWAARHERLAADANTGIGAAVHSIRAVAPDDVARLVQAAVGVPLHFHLSEQRAENEATQAVYGRSPTELLADAGALGPRSVAVHATQLSADDRDLLGRSQTCVCLCPTTERDLADGIGPGRALLSAGAPICVGSDSQAVIDLLEEVRGVEMHERLRTESRGHFTPNELINMLTRVGYAAAGWLPGGVIRSGGLADLVAVSTRSVRTAGAAAEELILAATAADVTDVVVGGVRHVVAGRHRLGDVGAALTAAIATLGEEE